MLGPSRQRSRGGRKMIGDDGVRFIVFHQEGDHRRDDAAPPRLRGRVDIRFKRVSRAQDVERNQCRHTE